ncbi:FAD-dependent oxidoreductase [Tenggerimyces flavus]|uniref:FAD-dependent oxidoreductase n=1 Tax=Tenggerimyces flavus TaxID=1708749 RepID=A0ABV7YLU5_9ACTN|nr:FAD-dependent oxidoreductase [Tenggerimyces flavus]MBM7784853.1 2-polyprenyl-6-methoxyphenol hydroxylase-like FAD-dependent oxidoreductase [Tenggerimyces flavus]
MPKTTCCVVGGGPAGMMLGLLLARAGIEVTVLEKHGDFLRDFRGDTVHASTLTLLDELGLGPAFERVPHRKVEQVYLALDQGLQPIGDLRRLPGRHQHIALVPQWDFLDLLADAAREEPTFELRMNTEVTGLIERDRKVIGVDYRNPDGSAGHLYADLVVGCDGRSSVVRDRTRLRVRSYGTPVDVWWFRLPRHEDDPSGAGGRVSGGKMFVLIDQGAFFQVGTIIPKGADAELRQASIATFRNEVVEQFPWLEDRVDALRDWNDVKLLTVEIDRLRRWYDDGVLCIGDAAHAMSPVGGVGINLAIQDAVATARLLAEPLRDGKLGREDLAKVQARRMWPAAVVQSAQAFIHKQFLRRVTTGAADVSDATKLPAPLRLLQRFPSLQGIPAYAVAIGLRPEHAPDFARREPEAAVA